MRIDNDLSATFVLDGLDELAAPCPPFVGLDFFRIKIVQVVSVAIP